MRTVNRNLPAIRRFGVLGALPAAALLLAGCTSEDPVRPDPDPIVLTVNQVVQTTGWFPAVVPDSTAFARARFDSTANVDDLSCTVYAGTQLAEAAVHTILAPQLDHHHPGAVLQYASLAAADLLGVDAERAGGTLVLAGGVGTEVTGEVAVIDGQTVDTWRREALAELGEPVPGDWLVSVTAVHGSDHVALAAGVAPAALPAAVRQQLALRDETSGRVLVRLERRHHTVRAIYPGSAGAAFAPTVTGPDVADQMSPGNPPVWVDTVTFGELALVLVEAAAAPAEVFAAVRRTFTAAVAGTAPGPGPLLDELPELGVRVFAAGADAEALTAATLDGLGALTAALQASPAQGSDLPPVTASLAALRNGGPVSYAISADFTFVLCEPFTGIFDTVLWSFRAADAHTVRQTGDLHTDTRGIYHYQGGANLYTYRHATHIPDLLGSGGDAVPPDRLPMVLPDAFNGHPAVELFEIALPGGPIRSRLRFDGTALVGRAYTLFVVLSLHPQIRLTVATPSGNETFSSINRFNFFLHGTGTNVYDDVPAASGRKNLYIGIPDEYPDNQYLYYSHSYYQLKVVHARPRSWHVYAFRFSFSDGMTAFVDGEQLGHSSWTHPLDEFANATLCARWVGLSGTTPALAGLLLAEIVAYDGAGSDEMVLAEMARLRAKYGL
jgi:hypothetical protein